MASNSANSNFSPTGDAINELEVSIPQVELAEKLFFAQFGNGAGLVSRISLLTLGSGEAVNAKLELLDDDGVPLDVVLNGELVVGETEIFRISGGGAAVFVSDGEGTLVSGSVAVSSDGPLSGVVCFDGGAINLGVAGVGGSEPLASFRAPMESRSGDPVVRTGCGRHESGCRGEDSSGSAPRPRRDNRGDRHGCRGSVGCQRPYCPLS